jgi:hypothetical protein
VIEMAELWGRVYGRAELLRRVGRLEQAAGVRLITLGDGTERGVRVLEFHTGSGFSFDVVVDRAFDIGRCEHQGRALSWQSATGFAGPWYYEPEGLGFLRTFGGGLLTTCGLDHALFMATDTAAQYHYPAKPTETYGLHGRVSGHPARLVGYGERWDGDECILWAEGEVLQAAVFGEHLLLRRRVEAHLGGSSLTIHDVVENVGYDPTPHMILYHCNYGFPVVDEGAELLLPLLGAHPRGDYPVEGFTRLQAPIRDFVEQVFDLDLATEPDGLVPTGIANRALDFGVYQLFRLDQLPHPFVWRNLGEGGYVVAIEPCTNRVAGRLDARARGELIELAPGESRHYDLTIGVLPDGPSIERFASRVGALQPTD